MRFLPLGGLFSLLFRVSVRYVYWGLSTGTNSPVLLKWHATLVEKCGAGAIMRVLTEKRVAENKEVAQ
jgi:hypothetical protein